MKKRFLNQISKIFVSTIFVTSVAVSALSVNVLAVVKKSERYELNDDITYTYKDLNLDGKFDTLIISGEGPIPTFKNSNPPWASERGNISDIVIEDGIQSIGGSAFYQFDSLKEVSIPDSVNRIGEGAFFKCSRLENIRIPEGVETIEANTFGGCYEIETVTIPKSVTEIGYAAFMYCLKLEEVRFAGNNLEIIGAASFAGCGFEEFEIPEGVERIKENAFNGCLNLTTVTIPRSVERIDDEAFERCPELEEVIFDCRSVLEYDEDWGIEEDAFILEHKYRNGVCTICNKKEKGSSDSDDETYVKWDDITKDTEVTFGTTTYNVKMSSKDTNVPYEVFNTLKGKNAVLNLKMDETFSWSINARKIQTPKELDLGVKIADKSIPLAVIDKYTKAFNYTELELNGNGDFGLEAELTIDVGTINNGNIVDLYYYNSKNSANPLEFIATSKVENGKVTLPFTHASKYVIDIYKNGEDKKEDTSFGFDDFAAGESVMITEDIL